MCNKTVASIKVDFLMQISFGEMIFFKKINCDPIYAQRSYVVLPFGKRMYLFLLQLHMNG